MLDKHVKPTQTKKSEQKPVLSVSQSLNLNMYLSDAAIEKQKLVAEKMRIIEPLLP
jgi:hypothetical protein